MYLFITVGDSDDEEEIVPKKKPAPAKKPKGRPNFLFTMYLTGGSIQQPSIFDHPACFGYFLQ